MKPTIIGVMAAAVSGAIGLAGCGGDGDGGNAKAEVNAAVAVTSNGPQNAGPIQVTPDGQLVFAANPDNDSVTMMNVAGDANLNVAEIPVGKSPRNLAMSPDGKRVFVANSGEDTVSVIQVDAANPQVIGTIKVGVEPYGIVFTPNGSKLYVANARSNTVSVLNLNNPKGIINTIEDLGQDLRGLASTNYGD